MCEWLSSGDWCDVQLFCGGRSFNAHRAVLASVSSFLRRILVSCPVEETPTCIFLPDFDLEAFSSVLYYVYNGEVAIQGHKLRNFLDVVKALEIIVDLQCLQKRNSIENNDFDLITYYLESTCLKNNSLFALDSGSSSDQQYINIKKAEQNQDVHSQYSPDESEFRDMQARFKQWTDLQPSLQNLPSYYSDRQKNSFLRDLFMETYSRNGNANGLSPSVLAISNKHYRAPASVLLTNANGWHPRAGDILSEITRKTADTASHIATKQNIFTDNNNFQKESISKLFSDIINSKHNDLISNTFSDEGVKNTSINLSPLHAPSPVPHIPMNEQLLPEVHLPSLDFNSIHKIVDPLQTAATTTGQKPDLNLLIENIHAQHSVKKSTCLESVHHLTRTSASIYNQVLENPWCPRIPSFNLPTIKRNQSFITDDKEVDEGLINDNNNNIQQPMSSSADVMAEKVLCSDQSFKCTICSQVFPSSASLAEHARRHSTAGRYTCGECGKTFSQLRNFKYHMSVHRGTREFAATCPVCGKYFNDRGYLSSHMKIHRNRKEYKCSMCPKSFNQRVAYNMHVRIHTGVKPHVCDQCGKAFSRKMLLKQHQRTHSGERPYACPHCDKRFADRSNMTLHLRLHTGIKPFSCSLCPKSFTKKHHLKSHLNFHTGAKPYSCPRCKLSFTQSSNMRTHFKKCNATELIVDT